MNSVSIASALISQRRFSLTPIPRDDRNLQLHRLPDCRDVGLVVILAADQVRHSGLDLGAAELALCVIDPTFDCCCIALFTEVARDGDGGAAQGSFRHFLLGTSEILLAVKEGDEKLGKRKEMDKRAQIC